jgi:putative ABC transport system permease protein
MIALVFAFFLMELMLPLFSAVIGQRLQFSYTGNPILLLSFILLALVVGVISGSYPAFFLSRFQIVEVVRTRNPGLGARRVRLRSALVVLQFFISTLFIAQTLILRNQIRYLTGKDIGFDKRNVVVIPLADESTRSGLNTIETRLRGIPGVAGVGAASILPGWYIPRGFKIPEGSGEDRMQLMDEITVDPGFIPTMGIAMLAGRNFLDHSPRDEQGGIIINETAARRFGWEDPIGRTIRSRNGAGASTTMRVCGVVKDFHLASLYRLIEPLCITDDPRQLRHLLVRIAPGTETESVGKIRVMWNQVFPDQPFDYSFLDQTYDHFFRVLERVLRVLLGFALLAVLIACLGIFALAAYTTERQTKAIGIRKVMVPQRSVSCLASTKRP